MLQAFLIYFQPQLSNGVNRCRYIYTYIVLKNKVQVCVYSIYICIYIYTDTYITTKHYQTNTYDTDTVNIL